ncbi:MAG TPA: hypothetical protein ENO34_03520 [Sulfurihydrogenibium azorense]|uniref:Uncharacterized protein n=1 Tax=Sulfurihydrogenibium azorense TaxID=309806 RepID=A0A832DQT3_9AQUI|nr:hypothetical protein [Sulfurihydrogenibium azorense]
MIFIKTRSGRYINIEYIYGFAVEEEKVEIEGRRRLVYKIVAYLPQPLLPAVLGIYETEERAEEKLEDFMNKVIRAPGKTIISLESDI